MLDFVRLDAASAAGAYISAANFVTCGTDDPVANIFKRVQKEEGMNSQDGGNTTVMQSQRAPTEMGYDELSENILAFAVNDEKK